MSHNQVRSFLRPKIERSSGPPTKCRRSFSVKNPGAALTARGMTNSDKELI